MSSNSGSIGDDVDGIARIARELQTFISFEDIPRARELVETLTREERVAVTRQKIHNDHTLLHEAVCHQKVESVRFLLEECHADVDPLLCIAAYYPLNEIVPLLVDHGANVNATTGYYQRTPVHIASGTANLNLVQYLIEKGADIHLPDRHGKTCLMLSVTIENNIKVSEYLIEQGASVNAVDNLGDTALHSVVRSNRLRLANHVYTSQDFRFTSMAESISDIQSIVSLLLRHGADTSIRNQSGDDALQMATLYGKPEIIDYLIDELNPTPSRCADLYSLVAARYVDEFDNFSGAMDLWKESVSMRMETPQDEPVAGPIPVFNGAVEFRDVESLEAIADDRDALYMQALICRERILGSGHYETIHWLSKRAVHYAKSNAYQRGIDLYKHGSSSCGPASVHLLRGLHPHLQFVVLLREKEKNDSVRFDDAVAPLKMMVGMSAWESLSLSNVSRIKYELLLAGIHATELLCRLKSSETESRYLRQLVRPLVRLDEDTTGRANILQYAIQQACSNAVEELLDAGADVNAVDFYGNTPLHVAVSSFQAAHIQETMREILSDVIDLLLRRGAHVDIRNFRGETAADRLPSTVDKLQYMTLQCLAARAIRRHRVTYHNILPTSMTQFVDLH